VLSRSLATSEWSIICTRLPFPNRWNSFRRNLLTFWSSKVDSTLTPTLLLSSQFQPAPPIMNMNATTHCHPTSSSSSRWENGSSKDVLPLKRCRTRDVTPCCPLRQATCSNRWANGAVDSPPPRQVAHVTTSRWENSAAPDSVHMALRPSRTLSKEDHHQAAASGDNIMLMRNSSRWSSPEWSPTRTLTARLA
jgi:hypothetical protein